MDDAMSASPSGGGAFHKGPVRDRLALALDVDDLVAAARLARSLVGHFRVAKVGLELYTAAGPEAIGAMIDLGYDVFCDLKLHDIPNTVNRAARVVGELGVSYLTVHAAGGVEMLRAGAEGMEEGATRPAGVLAVTVLTSEAEAAATRDLVMTCRPFGSAEAQALGFVNRVVPAPELEEAATELARLLASKSAYTLRATLRAVDAAAEALVPTGGAWNDADSLAAARRDPESRETARRYLESLGR